MLACGIPRNARGSGLGSSEVCQTLQNNQGPLPPKKRMDLQFHTMPLWSIVIIEYYRFWRCLSWNLFPYTLPSSLAKEKIYICLYIYICIAPFLPILGTAGSRWQEVPQLLVRVAQKKTKNLSIQDGFWNFFGRWCSMDLYGCFQK